MYKKRPPAASEEAPDLEETLETAYNRGLEFLATRPRSEQEVRTKLKQKRFEEDVIEVVIRRLFADQYLNEEEFVRYWIDQRNRFKPSGTRLLRYELQQKGVSPSLITQMLEEETSPEQQEDAVVTSLRKPWGGWATLDVATRRRRAQGHLLRRGFSYEQAASAIGALERETETDEQEDSEE